MKKLFAFLLAFSLLLVSCQSAPADETSSSSDTTEAIQTTDTEGTTASAEEPFSPDFLKNWLFSLTPTQEVEHPEDYDIALSLDIDSFSVSEMPDALRLHVVNKAGIPVEMCFCIHMEKLYVMQTHNMSDEVYNDGYMYIGSGWTRIPFATEKFSPWGEVSEQTFTLELQNDLKENFEYTPGRYRFVFYSGVGTHYAYFEITE